MADIGTGYYYEIMEMAAKIAEEVQPDVDMEAGLQGAFRYGRTRAAEAIRSEMRSVLKPTPLVDQIKRLGE